MNRAPKTTRHSFHRLFHRLFHRSSRRCPNFFAFLISRPLVLLSTLGLFVGALLLWRRRGELAQLRDGGAALAAGLFFGMGGLNLYDGIVQHKVLRLHPVRLGVDNILPYDLAWNAVALLLLGIGWWLWQLDKGEVRKT